GSPPNTRGIGSKIWLYGGAVPVQSQEMICGGRYLSCDDAVRVFAAGNASDGMRIEVQWRSGKRSVVNGVKANRIYEIDEAGAEAQASSKLQAPSSREHPTSNIQHPTFNNPTIQQSNNPTSNDPPPPVFEDVSHLIRHSHHEEEYNDFARQPLLPQKLSQLGPGVSWSDVDGDGREDLLVGSGRGGQLEIFLSRGNGQFQWLPMG